MRRNEGFSEKVESSREFFYLPPHNFFFHLRITPTLSTLQKGQKTLSTPEIRMLKSGPERCLLIFLY